jgi:hypothetical protein
VRSLRCLPRLGGRKQIEFAVRAGFTPHRHALACALALACVHIPAAAGAQKLEAAYVVLGPQGALARAIVAEATQCPQISIDGSARTMNVRAPPNAAFPVLVCEFPLAPSVKSARITDIGNVELPVLKPALTSIAVFGDTGCRLKAAPRPAAADPNDDDHGRFQDCNIPARWPFAQLAASVAAAKPDLVIHVGDYLYRESACPPRDAGCARSPHGDDWPTWKADFFAPAAPALRAAPWIVVRGNHEICSRAGAGYFRLLEPAPAQAPPPCVDLIPHFTVTVAGRSFIVLDSSNAADTCPCDSGPYAAQFADMRPAPGTWLLTHRPIWGFRSHGKTINATLQQALASFNGKLPDGIALALAGHIHVAEVLSFADQRSPQFVLGTGGTLLAGKIKRDLSGEKIAGTTISYGRSDHRFGFAMFKPAPRGSKTTFHDSTGKGLFACKVGPGEVACD